MQSTESTRPVPYYSDDAVTIYHGDCREILPFLRRVDAVVTDPPYGLGDLLHRPGPGEWSKLWESGAPEWDREALSIVASLPSIADDAIIWGGNYFPLPPARGWLVWDKIVREFSSGHAELAWTTLDQPVRAFNFANGQLASEGKLHPTQKPITLMRWCIGFLPVTAKLILDPFMGSGTTLRAAKDLGKRAIGIELDQRYCDIAIERCAQGNLFGEIAA
jgi:site-specific DNA-methyltransferase (adenine-specific)